MTSLVSVVSVGVCAYSLSDISGVSSGCGCGCLGARACGCCM